jgi:hypothetical protein
LSTIAISYGGGGLGVQDAIIQKPFFISYVPAFADGLAVTVLEGKGEQLLSQHHHSPKMDFRRVKNGSPQANFNYIKIVAVGTLKNHSPYHSPWQNQVSHFYLAYRFFPSSTAVTNLFLNITKASKC